MKKFTFMMIAMLAVAMSWAQAPSASQHKTLPEALAIQSVKTPALVQKEMAPRPALPGFVKAPAVQKTTRAKARQKGLDINSLLSGKTVDVLLKASRYDWVNAGTSEETPDYQLTEMTPAYTSEVWSVTVNAEDYSVSITGIGGGETAVTGTLDITSMTVTIPYGQAVGTTNYGTIGLVSATGAESLVGNFDPNTGTLSFSDYWYVEITDGDYAGEQWTDIVTGTLVTVNGTMDDTPVYIEEKEDTEYVYTVWNFGDFGTPIDVTTKGGGKFVVEQQLVLVNSTYGNFVTWGNAGNSKTIEGVGTEMTLTFGNTWTVMNEEQTRWYGELPAATITWLDGTFAYPEIQDVAAVPEQPTISFFHHFDGESAYVLATVPTEDVEGNAILPEKLEYTFYTMDEAGAPVALGESIAYTWADNGVADDKTVYFGKEAAELVYIGVKSTYYGGDEENPSDIYWFEIPQEVVVPEGLAFTEYPVTASAYNGSWYDYTGTVGVAIDGTDIYFQNILPHTTGVVKGTLEDGVVTIPVQYYGEYNQNYIYFISYDNGSGSPVATTFTYYDDPVFSSSDFIIANGSDTKLGFWYPYFSGMTIGEPVVPELVELPEGAFATEYPFSGFTSDGEEVASTVNVATVDNDLYIQGLNPYNSDAWVKGSTEDGVTYVFPFGQNFGTSGNYQFFLMGYDEAETDVVFTYDEKNDAYVLENSLAVNGEKYSLYYYEMYAPGCVIGVQRTLDYTFNFNEMDVPTSTNTTSDGSILADTTLYAGVVAMTITPAAEGSSTANRYWATKKGPQLRMYSNTLTFEVPDNYLITELDFTNNAKWNAGNSADTGEFSADVAGIWTGSAQRVVVTIAGNSQFNAINVTVAKNAEVTVGEAGYATYVAPFDLTFAGNNYVSAYVAQPVGNQYVHLEPVSEVPAGEAIIVKANGEAGTFPIDVTAAAVLEADNALTYSLDDVTADGTQYILANAEYGVGFYRAIAGSTIGAGKGYLVIEEVVAGGDVKGFYGFNADDATGIANVNTSETFDGAIYNLAGQRLQKMQKGVNIVGGKKILK